MILKDLNERESTDRVINVITVNERVLKNTVMLSLFDIPYDQDKHVSGAIIMRIAITLVV